MRYIGNKENLLDKISMVFKDNDIKGNSFFDFFSGTTNVGKFFKKQGLEIYSSDILYFSFVLQKAYLENNVYPEFKNLIDTIPNNTTSLFDDNFDKVIAYLNSLEGIEGFIYKNYTPDGTKDLEIPRMYFNSENGMLIDAIRVKIEDWFKSNLITESEYYILIASLIETVPFYANISGVYAAFHKKWDPRAVKKMILRKPEIIINNNTLNHKGYNVNSIELLDIIEADIFYLDPPYNQRQYAPNYHILETIAKYDNPIIKGVSGLRDYSNQKSRFCNKKTALEDLDYIAKNGKFKYLVLSYNNEGIMGTENIIEVLSSYGKLNLVEIDYARYKSNNNGENSNKRVIKEQLYILEKAN